MRADEMGLMDKLKLLQDKCLNMLVKPERNEYHIDDLGPQVQHIGGLTYTRKDFFVQNREEKLLCCSLFEGKYTKQMPHHSGISRSYVENQPIADLLVYCHSQTGNRLEGCAMLEMCSKYKLNLLVFDFAGCGHSKGDYVSLGWFEQEDLKIVIDHARMLFNPKNIFLWGRSMGAVAICRYATRHPNDVQAIVLDSPFDDLLELVKNIAVNRLNMSSMLLSLPIMFISRKLKDLFKVNLLDLKPREDIEKLTKPVFFIACKDEEVLPPDTVTKLYKICTSNQKAISVSIGNHNSPRDPQVIEEALFFIIKHRPVNDTEDSRIDLSLSNVAKNKALVSSIFERISHSGNTSEPKNNPIYDPFLVGSIKREKSLNKPFIENSSNKQPLINEGSKCADDFSHIKISPGFISNNTRVESKNHPFVSRFSFSVNDTQPKDRSQIKSDKQAKPIYLNQAKSGNSIDQLKLITSKKSEFTRLGSEYGHSTSLLRKDQVLKDLPLPTRTLTEVRGDQKHRQFVSFTFRQQALSHKEGPQDSSTLLQSSSNLISDKMLNEQHSPRPKNLSLNKSSHLKDQSESLSKIHSGDCGENRAPPRLRLIPTPIRLVVNPNQDIDEPCSHPYSSPIPTKHKLQSKFENSQVLIESKGQPSMIYSFRSTQDLFSQPSITSQGARNHPGIALGKSQCLLRETSSDYNQFGASNTILRKGAIQAAVTKQSVYKPFLDLHLDKENLTPNQPSRQAFRESSQAFAKQY